MPFDAIVMRAVTHEWEPALAGARLLAIHQEGPRVYLSVEDPTGLRTILLVVLTPAFRRIQRAQVIPRAARAAAWADRLKGSRIMAAEQVRWERVWRWQLEVTDDVGRSELATLVIELAGHLTNILWLLADGRVGDAYRRIAPGRPGRTIFPGQAYAPPPPAADPCATGRPADLPPWARRMTERSQISLPDLCRAYAAGQFSPWEGPGPDGTPQVWVYPLTPEWAPADSWSRAWARWGAEREQHQALADARRSVLATIDRELSQVARQLGRTDDEIDPDPERWRRLGDALLTVGPTWDPGARAPTLVDPVSGDTLQIPWRDQDAHFKDAAAYAYHRYKKAKAAAAAHERLVPHWVQRREALVAERAEVEAASNLAELARHRRVQHPGAGGPADARLPYRRFVGQAGTEIWVGRTDSENQSLTFQAARPDDLWFHVKQYPGSHVLLRCGKSRPPTADVHDAAVLAAFYSRAGRGSSIPVDYTPRKFVKKRPHGAPGQVLYGREQTLYVTPDREVLARLGARREQLVGEGPGHGA